MRQILFFLLCLCAASILPAQTYTGKVTDEKNQPLPYANVVLLSFPDSAFVTGTVSDESGAFTLKSEKPDLLLRVSSIGYATLYNKVEKPDLGTILLLPDAQLLGEVVVKGDLPKVRLKGDAMVTNVAGTILEKAGTGNDLLDRIPGVSANDGTVNVFGSGNAVIYINGRKMRNSSELDQLSSDNVKSVEVVRNPGARYEASVKAVIRIITKKAQGEGFGFNNRFYTSYQYDWNVLDQFNFNYRKGGFDLGGMLFGVNQKFEDNKTIIQRTYLDKVWEQASGFNSPYHSQTLSAMLSLNYQFNENHSIGARYDFDRRPKNLQHISMETSVTRDENEYERSQSTGMSDYTDTRHLLNMYYNGCAGDWSLDFNADGMWTESKNPQYTDELVTPAGGVQTEQSVTTLALTENRLYAAKLIAEHPLWSGNLSVGTEYTYSSQMSRYTNKEGILEDNHNDIKENAVSAFAEYAYSFGNLQARAGVRYEHLKSDYYEDGVKSAEQSRVYDNVFPSCPSPFQ